MLRPGIVKGYSDGTFDPGSKVTGAQFATILTRSFYPEEQAANDSFSSQSGYMPAMQTANSAGLLSSMGQLDGASASWKSSAGLPLNRCDMAQILHNILRAKNVSAPEEQQNSTKSAIKDRNQIPGQYRTAVLNCCALGVLNGTSGQTFSGGSTMNQTQACAVINRTMNYVPSPAARPEPPQTPTPPLIPSPFATSRRERRENSSHLHPEGESYSVTSGRGSLGDP